MHNKHQPDYLNSGYLLAAPLKVEQWGEPLLPTHGVLLQPSRSFHRHGWTLVLRSRLRSEAGSTAPSHGAAAALHCSQRLLCSVDVPACRAQLRDAEN